MIDDLRPPYRIAFDNARDPYAARNALGITSIAGSGGIAPANVQYITAAADATLTAERVLTNTASITWDFATAGQAKANVAASYGDVFLASNNTFTGNNYFAGTSKVHVVGHTAALTNDSSNVQVNGSATTGALSVTAWSSATAADKSNLFLQRSKNATVGTRTTVATNDTLGAVTFRGDDGTVFREAAQISAVADGVFFGSGLPGRMLLSTAAAGGTMTERMRIDSAGLATFAGDTTSANYPAGAWTAWTPTFSAGSGTITSTTINTARYTKHGKTITAFLDVTITNAGTGAGIFFFSLPVTVSASGGGVITGRENATTGAALIGAMTASATLGYAHKYDGSTIITTGYRPVVIIIYEGV